MFWTFNTCAVVNFVKTNLKHYCMYVHIT